MCALKCSRTRGSTANLHRTFSDQAQANSSSSANLRTDILEASIRNVPALGWTQESIAKAVLELGLPPLTHRVLGRGPAEMVEYFIEKKRNYAKERVAALHASYSSSQSQSSTENGEVRFDDNEESAADSESTATQNKAPSRNEVLQVAIEAHIDYIGPYINTWPSALAVFADPMQVSFAVSTGLQLADDIVNYGGIQCSRGDWYTERMLAVVLYTTTELYLLTDVSENFTDTRYGCMC